MCISKTNSDSEVTAWLASIHILTLQIMLYRQLKGKLKKSLWTTSLVEVLKWNKARSFCGCFCKFIIYRDCSWMGKVHVAGVVGVSTHNMVSVDQTTDWHALSYGLRGLQRPVVDALCRHHEGRLYTCCDRPPGAEYTYCFSPFVGIMRHDYCVHTSETCRHSLTPTTLLRRLRNLTTGVCEKVWKILMYTQYCYTLYWFQQCM